MREQRQTYVPPTDRAHRRRPSVMSPFHPRQRSPARQAGRRGQGRACGDRIRPRAWAELARLPPPCASVQTRRSAVHQRASGQPRRLRADVAASCWQSSSEIAAESTSSVAGPTRQDGGRQARPHARPLDRGRDADRRCSSTTTPSRTNALSPAPGQRTTSPSPMSDFSDRDDSQAAEKRRRIQRACASSSRCWLSSLAARPAGGAPPPQADPSRALPLLPLCLPLSQATHAGGRRCVPSLPLHGCCCCCCPSGSSRRCRCLPACVDSYDLVPADVALLCASSHLADQVRRAVDGRQGLHQLPPVQLRVQVHRAGQGASAVSPAAGGHLVLPGFGQLGRGTAALSPAKSRASEEVRTSTLTRHPCSPVVLPCCCRNEDL